MRPFPNGCGWFVESKQAASKANDAVQILNRVSAALVGGYVFTWGFVALGIAGPVALGVDFHEAEMAIYLLAFLVFLGLFLWAFSARSLLRVWTLLCGGGLLMTGLALAFQNAIVQ